MDVFADGLRNSVAIGMDPSGVLWDAGMGPDELQIPSLGVDIFNDNPAEEIHRFSIPGKSYGYPDCFSIGNLTQSFLTDPARGMQYAWPGRPDPKITDAWCRDPLNNTPPTYTLPAHSAPIGLAFLGNNCGKSEFAFPCVYKNDMFVTLHGIYL
jgi:glucose/arabinose dehydrogenase